jgi:hypothetical protein
MASTVTVTVPPDRGDAVLEALLTRYRAQAEDLRAATAAYLDDRRDVAPVLEHREELAEIEGLLDLVGWRFGPRGGTVELVGPPGLVRAVVHGSLVAVAEAFARDVERYERAEIDLAHLRVAADAVAELTRVFLGIETAGT